MTALLEDDAAEGPEPAEEAAAAATEAGELALPPASSVYAFTPAAARPVELPYRGPAALQVALTLTLALALALALTLALTLAL